MDTIRVIIRNPTVELWGWTSEEGILYYDANRDNDPYFSTFFESVVVPGEEVKEVELKDSVKEVIEQEWNPYFALVHWMSRVGVMTTKMYRLIGLSRDMSLDTDNPPVDMDYISHIIRILSMPEGWEQWVPLGSTPDLHHLRRMGVLSLAANEGEPLWNNSRPIKHFPTRILKSIYEVTEETEKDKMKILLSGILQDALVNFSTYHDYDTLHLRDIRWRILLSAMKNEKMNIDTISYNSVATLAREGRSDKLTIRLSTALSLDKKSPTLSFELDREDVTDLYDVALRQLPKDLDLQAMGLNSILQPGVSSASPIAINAMSQRMKSMKMRNAILLIVPIVHLRVFDLLQHYCNLVHWPHKVGYEEEYSMKEAMWTSKFLQWEVGKEGVDRVRLVILKTMLDSKNLNLGKYVANMEANGDMTRKSVTETDLVKALIDITSKK